MVKNVAYGSIHPWTRALPGLLMEDCHRINDGSLTQGPVPGITYTPD